MLAVENMSQLHHFLICMTTALKNTKKYIVTNLEFEAIVTSTKTHFFHQRMVVFVTKLELSDQKYQTIGNVRDENHKENFLLPLKDFVSFSTDLMSMYLMSTRLLKDNMNEKRILQVQLAYNRDKTHPSHKFFVNLCCEVHSTMIV